MTPAQAQLLFDLRANAARGMTIGPWRLAYGEDVPLPERGCFLWVHRDTGTVVRATPYLRGDPGIVVERRGTADVARSVPFDGTIGGYRRQLKHVLATYTPGGRIS